tara:strand:- start:314 stop:925 length:612 start_codon:yes stop_codon:yes gene_type:complete
MIAIINYGCGNINAFINVFKDIGVKAKVANKYSDLNDISKIILPGVGSFDFVMQTFNNSGLRKTVEEKVYVNKIPVLGVCAGMQILADSSDEGIENGLGWIKGSVRKLKKIKITDNISLPHMGWNQVFHNKNILFDSIESGERFYFVHSYYFENKYDRDKIGITNYSIKFTSSLQKDNIFGVQFHPEKSHKNGIQLLKNFSLI